MAGDQDQDHGFDDAATTRGPIDARPHAACARFVLEVEESPNGNKERGKSLVVDAGRPSRAILGKSAACDLAIAGDSLISRRHFAIDVEGRDSLRLTDLGSTNGTFVNGLRVFDVALAGGETVRVGDTVLRVRLTERDAAMLLPEASSFGKKLLGESDEMRRLYPLCERLAATTVPLVIEGETGTGKEVLAEALHEVGPRASGPFVVFDCTAVAPTLLEAALFGHERGAFTGAVDTRIGVFEEAHGGTLLIDEVGDLDISLQAKLLRALERSEVRRVGGNAWIKVDVRVIAATRRDLDREVQEGRFRDDLFFRLAVTRIELPPLRKRRGDVRLLAKAFWKRLARDAGGEAPEHLLAKLETQPWPGNVRELHHAVARHVALGELADVTVVAGTSSSHSSGTDDPFDQILDRKLPFSRARAAIIEAFEQRYVERLVADHGGNVGRAAEASGLARRYFQLLRARHKAAR